MTRCPKSFNPPPPQAPAHSSDTIPYYTDPYQMSYQYGDQYPFAHPEQYNDWRNQAQQSFYPYGNFGRQHQAEYPVYDPWANKGNMNGAGPSRGYHTSGYSGYNDSNKGYNGQQRNDGNSQLYDTNETYQSGPTPIDSYKPSSPEKYVPPSKRQERARQRSQAYAQAKAQGRHQAQYDTYNTTPDERDYYPSYPPSPAPRRSPPYHPSSSFHQARSPTPPGYQRSKRKGDWTPILPPADYLALVSQPPVIHTKPVPKLLILDLNGALLYRHKSGGGGAVYPRPFLGNFLEYLFKAEQEGEERAYEVFVWSSAQPHNVQKMVENAFSEKWIEGVYEPEQEDSRKEREERKEGRLLGVWARDKMNLNSSDYGNNVQTFKDLRKIIDHIANPDDTLTSSPMQFDEKRVLLLDDSPLKAVNQPFNQIVVSEFDKTEYTDSKAAFLVDQPDQQGKGLDQVLLGVIGILEALRCVDNAPSFVRSGGLTNPDQTPEDFRFDAEVLLRDLPSDKDFAHWFADPEILSRWIEKGKEALQRKGIEVSAGLDADGRRDDLVSRSTPAPERGPRAYSPSVPQEM